MLFNSWEFVLFLGLILVIYFSLPFRYRVWFLLVSSYYFYMRWEWEYVFLIFAQTLVNYEAGRRIGAAASKTAKKFWLFSALTFSLGFLGFFKYFNFFNDNFRTLFEATGFNYLVPHLDILLPVGISFYTFQTLSYTIDVYRGAHETERSFSRFALYVAFFPQLVAGPIERATHLLDQFKRYNHFDTERFVEGGKLIMWGLFKKVVIADRLSIYVDSVYSTPDMYSGSTLLLATYFFAFQIYCDFSGYSDIAIGSARILGYDLMQNFKLPYLARSISGFWKRWHISLTSWFTSYVYIPLGGSRVTWGRWLFNVSFVFLVSGLWHGANWTFVVWGALHGFYYFLESLFRKTLAYFPAKMRLPLPLSRILQVFFIFHLVLIAWVFFRASSLSDALLIIETIATDLWSPLHMGGSKLTTLISICLIGLLVCVQIMQEMKVFSLYFSQSRTPTFLRLLGYVGMALSIALLGVSSNAFIYFQF